MPLICLTLLPYISLYLLPLLLVLFHCAGKKRAGNSSDVEGGDDGGEGGGAAPKGKRRGFFGLFGRSAESEYQPEIKNDDATPISKMQQMETGEKVKGGGQYATIQPSELDVFDADYSLKKEQNKRKDDKTQMSTTSKMDVATETFLPAADGDSREENEDLAKGGDKDEKGGGRDKLKEDAKEKKGDAKETKGDAKETKGDAKEKKDDKKEKTEEKKKKSDENKKCDPKADADEDSDSLKRNKSAKTFRVDMLAGNIDPGAPKEKSNENNVSGDKKPKATGEKKEDKPEETVAKQTSASEVKGKREKGESKEKMEEKKKKK